MVGLTPTGVRTQAKNFGCTTTTPPAPSTTTPLTTLHATSNSTTTSTPQFSSWIDARTLVDAIGLGASRCPTALGTILNSVSLSRPFSGSVSNRPVSPRRRGRALRRALAERLANYEVTALKWLELGGSLEGDRTSLQKKTWVACQALCRAQVMCRSGVDLAQLSGRLSELSDIAGLQTSSSLPTSGDDACETLKLLEDFEYSPQSVERLETLVRPLTAADLSLPKVAAKVDLHRQLPLDLQEKFDSPAASGKPMHDRPCTFFYTSASEWRKAVRSMARRGMLGFIDGIQIDACESAGVFCLVKPDGTLRLICDRRPRNYMEALIGKARLPNSARLCRLLLPRNHRLRISTRDLKDFYYVLKVSSKRARLQQWGPRVPNSWLENLEDETLDDAPFLDDWWGPDLHSMREGKLTVPAPESFVQPVSHVVLMGDLNAVFIAQEFHIRLLESHGIFDGTCALLGDFTWKRDHTDVAAALGLSSSSSKLYTGLYIDDLAAISSNPVAMLSSSASLAEQKAMEVDAVYEKESLQRSVKKDQKDVARSKIWGPELHGNHLSLGVNQEKRLILSVTTCRLMLKPQRGSVWAACTGHWSNVLQLRRIGYSICQELYPFVEQVGLRKVSKATPAAKEELLILCCLQHLFQTDLSTPIYPCVGATDASETAAGVCFTSPAKPVPATTLIQLYDIAEFKGEHLRLDETKLEFSASENIRLAHSALLTMPLDWQVAFRYVFRFQKHINVLEAQAVLIWFKRLAKQRFQNQRVIILVDSAVVKGAVTKGRSGSRVLNKVLRQLAAICLAHNFYCELVWIPTWANPADAPSRNAPLSDWILKAKPYWEATANEFLQRGEVVSPYTTFEGIETTFPSWPVETQNTEQSDFTEPQKIEQVSASLAHHVGTDVLAKKRITVIQKPNSKRPPRPPRKRSFRCLELFAGKGGLGKALSRFGFKVDDVELFGPSGEYRSSHDITLPAVFKRIKQAILRRDYDYVHFGTPCSSFSVLNILFGQGTRTRTRPQGKGLTEAEQLGNLLLKLSLELIDCCIAVGIHWTLENPASSLLFLMPGVKTLLQKRLTMCVVFDQCEYGLLDPISHKRYKKATRVMGSFPLDSLMVRCSRTHDHEPVVGTVKVGNTWMHRSKLAGAYPAQLCSVWAKAIRHQLTQDHFHRRSRLKARH